MNVALSKSLSDSMEMRDLKVGELDPVLTGILLLAAELTICIHIVNC